MTIKEIAELAGVSISTVSKIVNNKDKNINQETRNRVLKIVKEYNYTPYSRARASAPTKTFLLGVLLRAAPNMDPMLNGILETAQNNGYAIIPLYSGNSSEHELKNISQLCKNRIDGVIWEPVNADSIKNEYHFTRDNIPVTYINSPEPSYGYFIDFVQLGYRMTQKLIDYKHRKIACLLQEKDWRSNLVFQGFEKCLFDNQIRYHDSLKMFDSDPLTISTLLTYDITGVISSHFTAALDLYARLNKMNYYIPSDLSLISLRDDSQDIISFPEISTYRISYQEFGRYVCSELIKTCEKQGSADAPGAFLPVLSLDGEGSIDVPSFLRTKRIIVVGTICADTICNVDQLPLAGRDSYIFNSTTAPGGKGADQAVAVARLGHEVALIGKIGNDIESASFFDILKDENVITQGVIRSSRTATTKVTFYIDENNNSSNVTFYGASIQLSPSDIQSRQYLFENAGFCLIPSTIPISTAVEAAKIAKKYDAKVILGLHSLTSLLELASLKALPEELIQNPEALLQNIDIIVADPNDIAALYPHLNSVEEQADYLWKMGIKTVIIILPSQGLCYLKTADIEKHFPAVNFPVVDTTGATDAFVSTLACYLIDGFSLESAISIANYAVGFSASKIGAFPSLVDKNTLEVFIKRVEPELLRR